MLNYPLGRAILMESEEVSNSTQYNKLQINGKIHNVVASQDSVVVIPVHHEDEEIGIIYNPRPPFFPDGLAEFPNWYIDEKNLSISANSREVANFAIRKVEEEMRLSTKKYFFVGCLYPCPDLTTQRSFIFILKVENNQKPSHKLNWFKWEDIISRTIRQQRSLGRIPFVENENIPIEGISLQVVNKLMVMKYDPVKIISGKLIYLSSINPTDIC